MTYTVHTKSQWCTHVMYSEKRWCCYMRLPWMVRAECQGWRRAAPSRVVAHPSAHPPPDSPDASWRACNRHQHHWYCNNAKLTKSWTLGRLYYTVGVICKTFFRIWYNFVSRLFINLLISATARKAYFMKYQIKKNKQNSVQLKRFYN